MCYFFCGRQGLILRGHRDDSTTTDTDVGNLLELVYFRATTDDDTYKMPLEMDLKMS